MVKMGDDLRLIARVSNLSPLGPLMLEFWSGCFVMDKLVLGLDRHG